MSDEATRIHRTLRILARNDLHVFTMLAFRELKGDQTYQDNWHVAAVARQLEHVERGDHKRQIISMPPRTMKSDVASIFYPAWLLGRHPDMAIICASYAQPLSNDFSGSMRRLMMTDTYRSIFPGTKIDPKRNSFEDVGTTAGGFRKSTSVGGVLTGRGADVIIIDDPLKASDANSDAERASMTNWYRGTLVSRLNSPIEGRIVVVSQRLHLEDLPGQLISDGGWHQLTLPLEEWDQRKVEVSPGKFIMRQPGHMLFPERFPPAWVATQRETMGERDFDAQYNQRPLPPGGALFKLEWLKRYSVAPALHQVELIVQSWDTAYEIGPTNDYSACTTWAISGTRLYLLDVFRARLHFHDLQKAVFEQRKQWDAQLVIVEGIGAGLSVFQNITKGRGYHWLKTLKPVTSKQDRASKHTPRFERGEILLPETATWLQSFESELLNFPHGSHDDQVDSMTQFFDGIATGNLLKSAKGIAPETYLEVA